ncbi:hypothetical protein CUMW_050360 [Citrus unshiu]|nr:hypothetical protein CUMW_050360 [Citrus unshiu]
MGEADEGGIARKWWIKFKDESVFAKYTPFFVCLASGSLNCDTFMHFISQDVHFLKAFALAYELAEECADDEEDKLAIRKLRKRVKQKLKTLDSLVRGKVIAKEIQALLNPDDGSHLYKKWIDYYCSQSFQESALQTEELLDKLSVLLTGEELEVIKKLYYKAIKLHVNFFAAQPVKQQTTVPLSWVKDPVEGHLTLFCDFDWTCTAFDSSSILAELAIVTAQKSDPDQSEGKLTWMSSADLRNTWDVLSTKYTEEYEQCIESIMSSEAVTEFEYEGLCEALKQLAYFEKNENSRVVQSGVLKGLNLEDIKWASQHLIFQDGCRRFFQNTIKSTNFKTDVHVLSYCWCGDLIRSAFASGDLNAFRVHSNELVYEESISTGEIVNKLESPLEKLQAFNDILKDHSNDEQNLTVYIGGSPGDLLCLLEADIGIVIGSSSSLRRLGDHFGVSFVPLFSSLVERQKELLKILLLVLCFYCYIGCTCFGSAKVVAKTALNDELLALLSIKAGLVDPLNSLHDWKLPSAHCNWTGVWCNSNGAVEKLDLSHMNLSGCVSDHFQRLKSLTSLNLFDVSQNFLNGSFPAGLGGAAGLTFLNASGNNFSGFLLEDLGNATSLETLDLRGSFFQGSIPVSFKNLQKLKFLGLSGNNLTGKIPRELGQLSSMETMILGYNEFEGEIPVEFGNLTNLKYLDLAVGNLGGEIPAELGRLELLEIMFLYQNNFQGKLPAEIGNITSLQLLDLSDNMLSHEIPAEITQLKNLQLLNLMCNQLSGHVPAGLGGLTQLEVLELWNNSLSGPLPVDLGKNSPLQWLDLSSNSFYGEIPASLCNGGNLTKLILFNNAFSGPIPVSLSTCHSLVRVRMQNNQLSGTIPVGFGRLEKLQRLELANNSLTGGITDDIASSTSLSFIDISRNHLRSSLPSTILSIPNLQTFIVSNNNLVGEIPDQFQDCPSLSVLDLSSNYFSGSIPSSIASCEKLVNLNLRNNQLTGDIPKAISMMPTLAILDLSNNSLTGGIPENFGASPALEVLNVSYNRLEGPVPANGVLRTINRGDLVGNAGLCGGVLHPCSRYSPIASSHRSLHAKHIIAGWMIAISSLFAVGIAVFSARSLYKRWNANGSCFEEKLEMGKGEWPWRLMAFQRLGFTSADILACIRESNVIGMGATGIVYKAEMPRLNTIVAVKKLWRSRADLETESSEALHGKQAGRLLVDWVSRYNIALGVAQGLAYLHHDCYPPIIHRDIKSNNILLDSNLEPRIADFGLARMMIRKNETVSMVAGSYGYIAPEYGYTLKVDEKIDIYSFGVVLLELLTGRRPLDPEFGESVDIVEWIRMKIRDNRNLEEALDPNVGNCKHVQEEMLLVLRIAFLCTAKLPKDRPSMRDVITMLGEAKPRRKSSSNNDNRYENNKEKLVFSTSPVSGLV